MALSQIQCLNEHHVNLRINQSKPGFLYSEEQRLALEKLLDEGPVCFQEFIKTNQIRPFLSDLELARLSASVEPYCPDLPEYSAGFDGDGDGDGTRRSLQYWPELSDDSLPQLELGWPQSASYRGVTRVAVHAQPPLHGDAHIKEVIRRAIAQAQKVRRQVINLSCSSSRTNSSNHHLHHLQQQQQSIGINVAIIYINVLSSNNTLLGKERGKHNLLHVL